MGCFSWLCKGCGKGVNSTSFEGDPCYLFLLKNGKVIQSMEGEYDSYGRVFLDGTQRSDVKHSLRESKHWEDPNPDKPVSQFEKQKIKIIGLEVCIWHRVCDIIAEGNPPHTGMAIFHRECYDGVEPTTRSESDPDQGWNEIGSHLKKKRRKKKD